MKTPIDAAKRIPKASRLESARCCRGLSLGEAAEWIGVSPSLIDKWERYKATPTEARMDRIAQVYCFPKEFFYGKELSSPESNSMGWDMRYKIEK